MSKKSDYYFLIYGYNSEYVLENVYDYLVESIPKSRVLKISDPGDKKIRMKIQSLHSKPVIFISSAHIIEDNHLFSTLHQGVNSQLVSPLEIISYLKPVKSIFFAHDLSMPIITEELPYLSFFDHIVLPYKYELPSILNTEIHIDLGWVKLKKIPNQKKYKSTIFFVSDIATYTQLGIQSFIHRFRPLLKKNITVKFPIYPTSKMFSTAIRKFDVNVLAPERNASEEILKYKHVITNGMSSTAVEALLLGRKTTLIRENFYPTTLYDLLKDRFPEINLVNECNEILLDNDGYPHQPTLSPFNFHKFNSIIF